MRKAIRKSSAMALGFAVVAALGGLGTSHAAADQAPKAIAHASAVLNQDNIAGNTVKVDNLPSVDHAGAALTGLRLDLTYTPLPNGAPTTITVNPNPTAFSGPSYQGHATGSFTFAGANALAPLLQNTDYFVDVVILGNPSAPSGPATGISYQDAIAEFSVRTATQLTLSIPSGNDTLTPFDTQTVTATLLDATNAPVIGQAITVSGGGGILSSSIGPNTKVTDVEGKARFAYSPYNPLVGPGAPWAPGTYTVKGSTVDYYTMVGPTGHQTKVLHTLDSNELSWDVLIPA